ncbi:MAG: nucleoside triphosphate pyrophosphohydrolase [Parcubacteria group bacterium]|jgi:predicted house-cleaning noncanonical NTP pyrophosphatase (MazG superfamily)
MNFKHFKTNLKKENEYPKLVRDNIPEIVEKLKGKEVKTRILENDEEYSKFLLHKVEEEANELANTTDKEHLIEEISDVKELLDTILEFNKLDWETVKKVQKEKAEKRGGFGKRILMLEKVD